MDKKEPEVHLKVGQVWLRESRGYKCFYLIKKKNSNNMWYLERLWATPALPDVTLDQYDKNWWHKERIIDAGFHMVGNEANVKTLKVLFG